MNEQSVFMRLKHERFISLSQLLKLHVDIGDLRSTCVSNGYDIYATATRKKGYDVSGIRIIKIKQEEYRDGSPLLPCGILETNIIGKNNIPVCYHWKRCECADNGLCSVADSMERRFSKT